MATSFGESTAVRLVYMTELVAVHRVKVGDRVECDGRVYRVFRWLRMVRPSKPLGAVAMAMPYDALGVPVDESVALCFDDVQELVPLVSGPLERAEVVAR